MNKICCGQRYKSLIFQPRRKCQVLNGKNPKIELRRILRIIPTHSPYKDLTKSCLQSVRYSLIKSKFLLKPNRLQVCCHTVLMKNRQNCPNKPLLMRFFLHFTISKFSVYSIAGDT